MGIETLTDDKIVQLLGCPKRVENLQAREKSEGKHLRRDYRVVSEDGEHRFALFTRQSTRIAKASAPGCCGTPKPGRM